METTRLINVLSLLQLQGSFNNVTSIMFEDGSGDVFYFELSSGMKYVAIIANGKLTTNQLN